MASIDELIEAYLDGLDNTEWIASYEAKRLRDMLMIDDPEGLRAWLDQRVSRILAEELARRSSHRRRQVHNTAVRPSVFARHLAEIGNDSFAPSRFDPLKTSFVVDDGNLRKPLARMTRDDHIYVALRHERRGHAAVREAVFHRAIARTIPDGATTADVYNGDQYLAFRARVVEETDGDAAAS